MCCHFTLRFVHLSHGEWPLMCSHFTLPFLHLSHGECLLMYHFTLPLRLSQGEWVVTVLPLHPTIPPSFWRRMSLNVSLYPTTQSFSRRVVATVLSLNPTIPPSSSRRVAVNMLPLYPTIPPSSSRRVAVNVSLYLTTQSFSRRVVATVLSLNSTIPPSFSRRVAVNMLSLYPTIPPSFSRRTADKCPFTPPTHRGHYILYLSLCGPLCALVHHVTVLTNEYYSPRTC